MSSPIPSEAAIRLTVFLGVFVSMALWELAVPFRSLTTPRRRRWWRNLSLVASYTLLVRVTLPAGAVGMAYVAEDRGLGVLNAVSLPAWLAVVSSVLVLDFVIYLQHVMFHAVPALWRLHMVHHADLDFDVTTGARFHPIEILLSMAIKLGSVALLGPPVVAVLLFEVVLNATAMFNHGNVRLPPRLDRALRFLIVTPDMHRVHHSVKPQECNSNFGFNLPWWDRLLGTYIAEPAVGQERMTIGLSHNREPRQTLVWMLLLPFRGRPGSYPFGRRPGGASAAGSPQA